MFNFLKSKNKYIPLNPELRKYFEHNLCWMVEVFPDINYKENKVLTPTKNDFPIIWDGSLESINKAKEIICYRMNIEPNEIDIDYFSNGIKKIDIGSSILFLEKDENVDEALGLYFGKNENGNYKIALEDSILTEPISLIATISHELSHVKLLGENRIDENDEMLTDLSTVFFGLGIFNANDTFDYFQNFESYGYKSSGYLKVEEWAYAFAIYSYLREETNPKWKKYLKKSIIIELDKCLNYVFNNEDKLFLEDD